MATLTIGALTTYTQIRRSHEVAEFLPSLAEAAATIGAAQIQNRGTLGGNAANASPAGDTLPILLAADAELVLGSARGERIVPATEFWPSYRQTVLAGRADPAHPLPAGRSATGRFRKVGTRRAQAISKVVMALAWQSGADGAWREVRLALGSVAATPVRAPRTEAALEGASPTAETADRRPTSFATRSSRSTTCALPPTTGARWLPASCIGSSATREVGDVAAA